MIFTIRYNSGEELKLDGVKGAKLWETNVMFYAPDNSNLICRNKKVCQEDPNFFIADFCSLYHVIQLDSLSDLLRLCDQVNQVVVSKIDNMETEDGVRVEGHLELCDDYRWGNG